MKTSLFILAALLCASGGAKTNSPLLPHPKGPAHFPLFCDDCYNEPVPGASCRENCGCTSAFCGRW